MKARIKGIVAISAVLAGSAASPAVAQIGGGTTATDQSAPSDQVVQMSEFEVRTTQGHGYTSTNAATAFLGDQNLMNIPQGLIVVTSDMIKDIALENSSDALEFAGASAGFQGESVAIRGAGLPYPYIDGFPDAGFFQDDFVIDSYELIKGAAEVFYVGGPAAGLILKTTKRPLPYNSGEVSFKYDNFGGKRATLDVTGPAGKIGDADIFYRVVGVYQRSSTYFLNVRDNRDVVMPQMEVKYHNTDARVYYEFTRLTQKENGQSLMTPDGNLFTGAGWDQEFYPPNDMASFEQHTAYAEILQKLSDNWELKIAAEFFDNMFYGPGAQVIAYDWALQQATFENSINNRYLRYYGLTNQWNGKYDLGPEGWRMPNSDSFGATFDWQSSRNMFWTGTTYNGKYGWDANGDITVPMTTAAVNSILIPPTNSYYPPDPADGGTGNESETFVSNVYWEHNIDVIPNWFSLSAAGSWATSNGESIANISLLPWQPKVVPVGVWLHRYAGIFHATKDISIYAIDSTTFSPPSNGALTFSGGLLPPGQGKARELGMKTSFFNGRLSTEFGWFRILKTNVATPIGFYANGNRYFGALPGTIQEGVDGDVQFSLLRNWQIIGTFYTGHIRNGDGTPVNQTYDNSWSLFTRYDFGKVGPFGGFAIGGGANRIGSIWIDFDGLTDAPGYDNLPSIRRQAAGTMLNAFATLNLNKHWVLRVDVQNILNQAYPIGSEGDVENIDPSVPLSISGELTYKY